MTARARKRLLLAAVGLATCVAGTLLLGEVSASEPAEPAPASAARVDDAPNAAATALDEPVTGANARAERDRSARDEVAATESARLEIAVTSRRLGAAADVGVQVMGRGARQARTNADGVAVFAPLPPGRWEAMVLANTVPDGLLPPRPEHGAGDGHAFVVLSAGDRARISLQLCESAELYGVVTLADGTPLPGAQVRAQCTENGMQRLCTDATTDANGLYVLRVQPGSYRVNAWALAAEGHRTRPFGIDLEVAEGSRRTLPPLVFDSGTRSIRGRVVDATGAPVAGLEMHCWAKPGESGGRYFAGETLAEVVTDPEGRFAFERLPAELLLVKVDSDACLPSKPVEQHRLARYPASVAADLRVATEADVGDFVVALSAPFVLTADLRTDDATNLPEGGARTARKRPDVDIRLLWNDGKHDREVGLAPDAEGRYRWACQTPHPPVTVAVARGRSRHVGGRWVRNERSQVIQPVPNGTQHIVLTPP